MEEVHRSVSTESESLKALLLDVTGRELVGHRPWSLQQEKVYDNILTSKELLKHIHDNNDVSVISWA